MRRPLFLLWLLVAAPMSWTAQAQNQVPPSVEYDAHDPSLMNWHSLPPIFIRSARLTRDDGFSATWDVVARRDNFAVVRTVRAGGAVIFSSYTGPQRLNHAWIAQEGLGERVTISVESVDAVPPVKALQVLDGVAAEMLGVQVILRQDGTGGPAVVAVRREVRDARWLSVEVNGSPYLLKSFDAHVEARQGEEILRAGTMTYVPVLGLAVEGVIEIPRRIAWRFEGIRVDPDVLSRVEAAAFR